jgi:hypothetical protein
VLRAVPGVTALNDRARPGDPWRLSIAPNSDPAKVRSAVLAAVAAEQLPLTSIRAIVPSLEDIYRRAVSGPRDQARPAPDSRTPREVPA